MTSIYRLTLIQFPVLTIIFIGVSLMAAENSPTAIEVTIYGKAATVSDEHYQTLMAEAEPQFARVEGIIDAAAYYDASTGLSCDIIWWTSRKHWQAGPEKAMKIPEIASFFAALDQTKTSVRCYQRALPVLVTRKPDAGHVLEVAQFRLAEGADPAVFIERCQDIRTLLQTWDGFLQFDTLQDPESGEWVDLVCWSNRESADAALQRIQQAAAAGAWMKMIDPKHTRMHHFVNITTPSSWR